MINSVVRLWVNDKQECPQEACSAVRRNAHCYLQQLGWILKVLFWVKEASPKGYMLYDSIIGYPPKRGTVVMENRSMLGRVWWGDWRWLQRGSRKELFGVMEMFCILIVVMFTWIYVLKFINYTPKSGQFCCMLRKCSKWKKSINIYECIGSVNFECWFLNAERCGRKYTHLYCRLICRGREQKQSPFSGCIFFMFHSSQLVWHFGIWKTSKTCKH